MKEIILEAFLRNSYGGKYKENDRKRGESQKNP